jgi:hypothetical protein
MSARDLKFVIFRDMKDGYRWRLRSTSGQWSALREDTAIRVSAHRKCFA